MIGWAKAGALRSRRRPAPERRCSPRGQALAGVACRRRQKKYESPQSTPVAAAQPHASGPSSCGRPPVQSVRRALRHLVAYGSTNKYRPVNRSKASGNTAKRPSLELYFPCTTATPLTMTATVKAMDSQRWVCRTHLFQFNGTSCEDEPEADRAHLQVLRNRFTTLEPPEAASWAFQYRTA